MHRKSSAFTLIELLVVIAIIAILAAILFPVFAQAREKARQTSCTSNMKQLDLGFIQYVQDYDETLPFSAQGLSPAPPTAQGNWIPPVQFGLGYPGVKVDVTQGALYSYIKSAAVFICPSDANRTDGDSYSMNLLLSGQPISIVPKVADMILLIDEQKTLNDGNFSYATVLQTNGAGTPDTPTTVHSGGGNLAFLDGHAKWRHGGTGNWPVTNFDPTQQGP